MNHCTFKFYTKQNQRIAAFAEQANNQLMIVLFICSAKDSFSKKLAKAAYERWKVSLPHTPVYAAPHLFHPKQLVIDFEGDPRTAFLDYMEENYYRKADYVMRYVQPMLYQRKLARQQTFPEGSFGAKVQEKGLLADDPVIKRTHWTGTDNIIYVGKGRVEATKLSMR